METEIEELFKKDEDVCIVCGYVSANEFFSFPSDVDTRQQWATFCDLAFDMIKPHFRLCDRHFKTDDYRISIQRKLLIPTSVPTLQPKLNHGFASSINNSLQSSANFINFSNPTLNKNASKNAIYSPVFQSNTTTDASNKQFRRIFGDITNKYDDDVPPKAKKLALKRKLKVKQSQQQTKCFRSEIFRLGTRCSRLEDTVVELRKRIERLDERCFVVPAESDRNMTEDTRNRRPTIYSSEKPKASSCITEALTEKHYEKVAFVETTINGVEVTHQHQRLTTLLPKKSSDDRCNTNIRPPEQHSEKVTTLSTDIARNTQEVTCDANFTMFSNAEYNDSLSNAEAAWPEDRPKKDALVDAESVVKVPKDTQNIGSTLHFPGMSNDDLHNAEEILEQHCEEVALVESVEKVADEDGYSTDSSMPPLEISSNELHTSEGPLEKYSAQASLVEFIEKVTEDCRSAGSFILPLKISSGSLHNSEEQLEQFPDGVVPAEIDRNVAEDTLDQTAVNGVEGTHQHQSLTTLLLEKTNDDPCNTTTRLPEQDSEKDATASTEIAGNVTEATCSSNLTMFSEVECIDSLSNADVAPPEDYSKNVTLVESESVENVLKDTHNIDSTLQFPGMSNDDLHNTQERLEQHSEEIALVESVENIAEDGYSISIDSSMSPLEISNDVLHSSEDPLERFSREGCSRYSAQVACSETSTNVGENNRDFLTVPSPENSNISPCNTETQPNEHFEKEAYVEHVDEDIHFPNLTALSTQILNDDGRCNAEMQSQQHSEGDPASKDSQNCFSDLTQTTNDVSLDVLDDNEVVSGISISPKMNFQLRKNDTSTNSNNELFDNAHVGQTLQTEQVQVTTQQPNCNDDELNVCQRNGHASPSAGCSKRQKNDDEGPTTRSAKKKKELPSAATTIQTSQTEQVQVTTQQPNCNDEQNVFQRNGHASPSAGCSKRQKNDDEGPTTRSAKKKKELPSAATTIQTSDSVPKKVEGVLMRDSPPYCCNICDKTFSDKRYWRTHQRKHSKPFLCSKCKKPFAGKHDLFRHQATHIKKKPYKCGICGAGFKYKRNKSRHERYMHTEVACFECAVCGKMFNYKESIIQHLRVHSGQKPFRCQTCGARFAQKIHLVTHQTKHSKEKKFNCRICNKLFKHQQDKARHEHLHEESPRYECALCGKKYSEKRSLAYHISFRCS